AVISILTIVPAYLIYYLLMLVFKQELISFAIMCVLLGIFFVYAFFKNPKLLGEDFVQLQKELVKMIKNKGKRGVRGKRKRQNLEEEETGMVHIIE
ncbi:MAG TPA: hypothetical protein VN958_11695, partial [Chitinophagaceae bacterium]|nr:hypothetical protein [Chitinophagaceae bacterium]